MIWLQEFKLYWLVLLLALGSWWISPWQTTLAPSSVSDQQNSPDVISNDYVKITMGKDGLPKSELHSTEMLHFRKLNINRFQAPVMTLFKPNQAPWVIQSEQAELESDGDTLHMNGKTLISRKASANNDPLVVKSADLMVKLDAHFAKTQAYSELISPPHKTTGTGMEVVFVSPIDLKLLSSVKGHYELNKKPSP